LTLSSLRPNRVALRQICEEFEHAEPSHKTALFLGAGSGLSASLARLLAGEGLRVALAARNSEKLAPLCAGTGAKAFACHATDPRQVGRMFAAFEAATDAPPWVERF
jgi:NADP-dependent 3-hydroxy acid dehydrogenase YdfG